MFRLFTFAVLGNALIADAFSVKSSSLRPSASLWSTARGDENHIGIDGATAGSHESSITSTRRETLARAAASLVVASSPLAFGQQQALAAESKGSDEGMVSQPKLASLLKQVPTFAIVDPRGVPFFVVGEDAKLTSYFFLSYGEAKRILDVAISSSDKAIKATKKELKAKKGVLTKEDEEEIGINPWKNARVTSVPLDLAVTLASKGKLGGGYFRLAPSESDIEAALEIDGTDDLPEGKCPMFYVEDMTIAEGDGTVSPLYFQKDQLLAVWKKQQKKEQTSDEKPTVKVTELIATVTEMIRPGGTDEELKKLQFIAPVDSKANAAKCLKGEKEPFRLGERLIVL